MKTKNIKDLSLEKLTDYFENIGLEAYRAKQCFKWLCSGVKSFDEMTDIRKDLRERLKKDFYISVPEMEKKQVSSDGTVKYLFKNRDSTFVETVIMTYKHGLSACLSTQVGCNMGCKFCASTVGGKERNLTAGEIMDQLIFAGLDLNKRISHIVLMGMGEPLDNYDNVITFLRNVSNENGLNLSLRHISLSTCGLADRIYDLASEKLPITLSVSLHAPNDETRSKLMPINRKYNLSILIKSLKHYIKETNRRISIEYILIDGVNDSSKDALMLASILKGMLCHVNLIPFNNVRKTGFQKSKNVENFKNILANNKINATVRRELGSDIDAACGQLRKRSLI